jgi:hypothetical protein
MWSKSYRPVTGFFLSLSGGILILFGGIAMVAVKALLMAPDVPTSILGAAYTGYELLRQEGFANGIFYWAAAVSGLVSGVAIIYAAAMMMRRAVAKTPKWAEVVLVFSFVSLIGIGGFMAGAVLGILGGATAISWEQTWLIRFRKNRQERQTRGG